MEEFALKLRDLNWDDRNDAGDVSKHRACFRMLSTYRVVTPLPKPNFLMMRSTTLKKEKDKVLLTILQYNAQRHLPFPSVTAFSGLSLLSLFHSLFIRRRARLRRPVV